MIRHVQSVIVATLLAQAVHAEPHTAITQIHQGVVAVISEPRNGSETCESDQSANLGSIDGTGFFIHENYLVTAAHVIKPRSVENSDLCILLENKQGERFQAELVSYHDKFDIALIRTTKIGYAIRLNSDATNYSATIHAIGHPYDLNLGRHKKFHNSPMVFTGLDESSIPSKMNMQGPTLGAGTSGGPVLKYNDREGFTAVGLTLKSATSGGQAIPIRDILPFLENSNLVHNAETLVLTERQQEDTSKILLAAINHFRTDINWSARIVRKNQNSYRALVIQPERNSEFQWLPDTLEVRAFPVFDETIFFSNHETKRIDKPHIYQDFFVSESGGVVLENLEKNFTTEFRKRKVPKNPEEIKKVYIEVNATNELNQTSFGEETFLIDYGASN